MGDWPIHIFNAQHGKIRYLNDVMATYRVHKAGAWSGKDRTEQVLESLKMLDYVDQYLGFRYTGEIKRAKAECYYQLTELELQANRLSTAKNALTQLLKLGRFSGGQRDLGLLLRVRMPSLYRCLKWFRDRLRPAATISVDANNSLGAIGDRRAN
jgi:hypothetical protein